MLYGKTGVRILIALLSLCLFTAALPYFLKWNRRGPSHHEVTDVRDERFLHPYNIAPSIREQDDMQYSIHGKLFSFDWDPNIAILRSNDEDPLKPSATIEVPLGEEGVLPDGNKLRFSGFRFMDQTTGVTQREVSVHKVYYNPSGVKMSAKEAESFHQYLGQSTDSVWTPQILNGPPSRLEFFIESDKVIEDQQSLGLRDVITGGEPAINLGVKEMIASDGEKLQIMNCMFEYTPLRPTLTNLHLKIWQGEPTSKIMKPEIGESFRWNGNKYEITNIKKSLYTNIGYLELDDDRLDAPNVTILPDNSMIEISFNSLPIYEMVNLDLVDSTGKALGLSGGGSNGNSQFRSFRGDLESMDHLEFRLRSEYVHVVFELPELPGILEENRQTNDLMEMKIPSAYIANQDHFNRYLGTMLQVQYYPNMKKSIQPPVFPKTFENMTLKELLKWEYDQYPDHEILLSSGRGSGTWMNREIPSETIKDGGPLWVRFFFPLLPMLSKGLFIITLILFFFKVRLMIYSHSIQRQLHLKGYTDVDLWKAEMFFYYLDSNTKRIPNHDELATIPGVDADDPKSIAKFLQQNKQEVS